MVLFIAFVCAHIWVLINLIEWGWWCCYFDICKCLCLCLCSRCESALFFLSSHFLAFLLWTSRIHFFSCYSFTECMLNQQKVWNQISAWFLIPRSIPTNWKIDKPTNRLEHLFVRSFGLFFLILSCWVIWILCNSARLVKWRIENGKANKKKTQNLENRQFSTAITESKLMHKLFT